MKTDKGYVMKNKPESRSFSQEQGKILISLARKTIADKLGADSQAVTIPDDPEFTSRRGTFVTLKIDHELRGCIGSLSSDDRVVDGIRKNAVNAAFNDYRFTPLTQAELSRVDIEVSILTEAKPLNHSGGEDLLTRLKPGVDGVIIRKGSAGATFLPQVWEQLPLPRSFMEHLCAKAGLPRDAWTSADLQVSVYQVQYFEENRHNES